MMALTCPDEMPLLSMVSLAMPALAMGNRVVVVPSQSQPLLATDFYQILETSDVPAGSVNIVTGARNELAKTLADHDEVAAMWYHGDTEGAAVVEKSSAGNLKATFEVNFILFSVVIFITLAALNCPSVMWLPINSTTSPIDSYKPPYDD